MTPIPEFRIFLGCFKILIFLQLFKRLAGQTLTAGLRLALSDTA